MDIRKWGLDRIMQLPDGCFGRRWPIIFSGTVTASAIAYYISEMALPERCVIWQLFAWTPIVGSLEPFNLNERFSYKLGDQLPNAAIFASQEELFAAADMIVGGERSFYPFAGVLNLRQPVMSSGRRITIRVHNFSVITLLFCTGIVISSVPNEVPDCLVSA